MSPSIKWLLQMRLDEKAVLILLHIKHLKNNSTKVLALLVLLRFQYNAMRFVCYTMSIWNEGLFDFVRYGNAVRFYLATPPYTDELQIFQSKMIRSQGLALNCNVNFILHNKSILNRVKTCCMLCYMYVLQWNDMAKRIYEINALMYEIPMLCYVVCCKIFAWTYFTYVI